jgi:Fe-S oxidoreductase
MYDEVALGLFAEVKRIFDPDNLLNPGVLVDPAPLDTDIRLAGVTTNSPTFLRLPDDGSLVDAVHRCTGVGKCLADNTGVHGVMCPSYQATRDEKDSTRGRARVLQELVTGRLPGGAQSSAVEEALDLCLACKGCARDCPTGVDMAAYRAEWLHQRYAGKRRPLTHYTLGRLPATLARVPSRLASSGLSAGRLASMFAGVDRRRSLPRPARQPVSASPLADRSAPADVTLWVDTFTNRFAPEVAEAAVQVLEAHSGSVQVLAYPDECCGLTWMSTGQLEQARDRLARLMARVDADSGDAPVVVLEPSCLAMLRRESAQLLPQDSSLAGRVFTLAEHLSTPGRAGWAPNLNGVEIVAQPHCHHTSVLGWQADESLLRSVGAELTRVGGCCGLAGDWGMEKGHYDVSVAVFEHDLGPAVRAAGEDAVVLADGFSCRTQLADLAGVQALTLAQLLADSRFDRPKPAR